MPELSVLLSALAGYILGSLSFSIVMSRVFFKADVRTCGSGNAGATNMARVFGAGAGALTLLFDVLKALLSVWLGRRLAGDWGFAAAGIACVIGHCYPVFYRFKGGKAVAVGLGLAFALNWRYGLLALVIFAAIVPLTKKASLGSLLAMAGVMIAALIRVASVPGRVMITFAALMIVLRHAENIKRLINGTEPDFSFGHKKKE